VSGPNFEELMEGASPGEEARLRQVHDMLVAAGPPPELPESLAEAPSIKKERPPALTTLPRRRLGAVLVAAAGIAAAAFFAGYVIGGVGSTTSSASGTVVNIPMRPTPAAPGSAAVLALPRDSGDKNVPMTLTVSNLKHLPKGGYYELWLTRAVKANGKTTQKMIIVCGTFIQNADRVEVKMNAPYTLDSNPGWVITRHLPGTEKNQVVLTT
jgi:hypothetical protein